MTKKIMFVLAAAAFMSKMVYAGDKNNAGCEHESLLFNQNNVPGTANNMSLLLESSESSAITTGTSICTAANGGSKSARAEWRQERFATQNWRDLNRQMASGGGEYVSTLSKLMGCSKKSQGAFAHFAQTHYSSITGGPKAVPSQVIKGLRKALARDPNMSLSCSLI